MISFTLAKLDYNKKLIPVTNFHEWLSQDLKVTYRVITSLKMRKEGKGWIKEKSVKRKIVMTCQKRVHTRATLKRIWISRLDKIPTFYRDGWDPWSKKSVYCLSCIKGKGGGKDIHCSAQNVALL